MDFIGRFEEIAGAPKLWQNRKNGKYNRYTPPEKKDEQETCGYFGKVSPDE